MRRQRGQWTTCAGPDYLCERAFISSWLVFAFRRYAVIWGAVIAAIISLIKQRGSCTMATNIVNDIKQKVQ